MQFCNSRRSLKKEWHVLKHWQLPPSMQKEAFNAKLYKWKVCFNVVVLTPRAPSPTRCARFALIILPSITHLSKWSRSLMGVSSPKQVVESYRLVLTFVERCWAGTMNTTALQCNQSMELNVAVPALHRHLAKSSAQLMDTSLTQSILYQYLSPILRGMAGTAEKSASSCRSKKMSSVRMKRKQLLLMSAAQHLSRCNHPTSSRFLCEIWNMIIMNYCDDKKKKYEESCQAQKKGSRMSTKIMR